MNLEIQRDLFTRRVFWFLITCTISLLLIDIFFNFYQWVPFRPMRRMLNIAREDSIGTWFMTTLMLFNAIVLFAIYSIKKIERTPQFWGWLILALFYFYLGIDDAIKFHERVGSSFKLFLGGMDRASGEAALRTFFPSYTWQVVFMPFFSLMGLFILWFLKSRLNPYKLFRYVILALSCYSIAVLLDFFEGLDAPPYRAIGDFLGARYQTIKHMSKAIEETLEILGTVFFFRAYLRYLLEQKSQWKLSIK